MITHTNAGDVAYLPEKELRQVKDTIGCIIRTNTPRVLEYIKNNPDETVKVIACDLRMGTNEVSKILHRLRRIKVVESRKEGRLRFYKVTPGLETILQSSNSILNGLGA